MKLPKASGTPPPRRSSTRCAPRSAANRRRRLRPASRADAELFAGRRSAAAEIKRDSTVDRSPNLNAWRRTLDTLVKLRDADRQELGQKFAATLSDEELSTRLGALDAEYKAKVEQLIPEVSPWGKQVEGSAAKREQLWRNYSGSKKGAPKIQTVKQEEFTMAENQLHDMLAKHADDPELEPLRQMIRDRQALHSAQNARRSGLRG